MGVVEKEDSLSDRISKDDVMRVRTAELYMLPGENVVPLQKATPRRTGMYPRTN